MNQPCKHGHIDGALHEPCYQCQAEYWKEACEESVADKTDAQERIKYLEFELSRRTTRAVKTQNDLFLLAAHIVVRVEDSYAAGNKILAADVWKMLWPYLELYNSDAAPPETEAARPTSQECAGANVRTYASGSPVVAADNSPSEESLTYLNAYLVDCKNLTTTSPKWVCDSNPCPDCPRALRKKSIKEGMNSMKIERLLDAVDGANRLRSMELGQKITPSTVVTTWEHLYRELAKSVAGAQDAYTEVISQNDALQERIEQFQFCIEQVAQALGVSCGGVDSSPQEQVSDPSSTTKTIVDAIKTIQAMSKDKIDAANHEPVAWLGENKYAKDVTLNPKKAAMWRESGYSITALAAIKLD